jgi:predicted NUDIX family NTP pyrophosphohydrolase
MAKRSAGLAMYRIRDGALEILLVHPGGPYWAKKDRGAWFLPKGEVEDGEEDLVTAKREFEEETGLKPNGPFFSLGSVKQKSGKLVSAWAFEGDCDPSTIHSNTFTMEWPPRSGKQRSFPEIDRAAFFTLETARDRMHPAEFAFFNRLHAARSAEDGAQRNTRRSIQADARPE